ncbi:transcription factor RFX4-like isoform X1 [Haliotis rufescens]|uniref:transcription factor RFX4-like isoform X1 n=1 Tax=Haliotis rufescens TaxID=6454 RepID=UPI001EB07593|nr:transcription factor RFX4-like isoform X1 [Haliotis rufescens]
MEHLGDTGEPTDWFEHCLDPSRRCGRGDGGVDEAVTEPDRSESMSDEDQEKTAIPKARIGSKPHSTPQTLKWLEENYEIAEGVCIPRSTLYLHYLDFCEKNDTQPVNAASFGKIIRQQFPQITTRRLGTRGQSKYHYYGIGVRESSQYFEVMYSAKAAQGAGDNKKDGSKQMVAYSPRSKLGTLLPDFPDIKDVKIPPNIDESKVVTFLMMYRTHCQRILDTVIRANFEEVQSFLLHFWQGMPAHMVPILDCQSIVMLVGVCDSILYKAIASVLMPTVLQALPDSLTQVIRRFARQLDEWLKQALDTLPDCLQRTKFDLARRFAQVLRRQTSLNHLCQAARSVIHSSDITLQMLDDWLSVDLSSIVKQTLYTMDHYSEREHETIFNLCTEFERLLEEQAPIESYIEWLDSMVDRCVIQPSLKKAGTMRRLARQFLLMWSCFGTRVIRDMTLHSSPSFGSFHLLHLMFDDYVMYLVENLYCQERANDFLRAIKGENSDNPIEDIILPDPSVIKDSLLSPADTATLTPTIQERGSVITNARNIMSHMTAYDDASGVTSSSCSERLTNQNKVTPDSPRSRHPNSIAQGNNQGVFQSCTSYSAPYSQGHTKTTHAHPGGQVQYNYDVTSGQMPGQLTDDTGRQVAMSQSAMRSGGIGTDWSLSNHPRQQTSMNENVPPLIKMNETHGYTSPFPPSIRQSGMECGGYNYDNVGKPAPQTTPDNSAYGYHGYSPVGDFYNFTDPNSKRKLEEDTFFRSYKRQTKDFYYENIPGGFAQM